MKRVICLLLALALCVLTVGCTNPSANPTATNDPTVTGSPENPDNPENTTAPEATQPAVTDPPKDVEAKEPLAEISAPATEADYLNNAKIKSLLSLGNTYRLKAAINKARTGQDVTIGYIGGSITYGDTLNDRTLTWANRSYEYFAQTYGTGENVHYVNSGVNGTPSAYGALRVNADILAHNPDIVFIEFAVNDGSEALYGDSYECLIRECLTHESKPAVVIMFAAAGDSWWGSQSWQKKIAEKYDLPMVSYRDGVEYLFNNNVLTLADFTTDKVHPNIKGHGIVADFVKYFFDEVYRTEAPASDIVMPERIKDGLFQNASILRQQTYTPAQMGSWKNGSGMFNGNGWRLNRDGTNNPIVFKFTGKNAYIVYASGTSKEHGTAIAKVYYNGNMVGIKELKGNGSSWEICHTELLHLASEVGEYTVEVSMASDATAAFEIQGVGYTAE